MAAATSLKYAAGFRPRGAAMWRRSASDSSAATVMPWA